MSLPTIRYFKGIGARALPAMLALEMAGLPYAEVRYTSEEWQEVKMDEEKHPTHTLPSLTIAGTTFGQSRACAAFAARAAGLLPMDPMDAALNEECEACIEELFTGADGIKHVNGDREKFLANNLSKWFGRIERIATGDTYFLAGDKPGMADFWLVAFIDYLAGDRPWIGGVITKSDIEEYKIISRIVRATKAYAPVKRYYDRHPEETTF